PNPYAPPDAEMVQVLQSDAGRTTPFWLPAIDKTGIRPSHFIGTDTKLSFISLSHVRIYKEAPESAFAKVTYETLPDPGNREVPDSLMLRKTECTNVFDDDDRRERPYTHKFLLLHGIKKIKYRYWRRDWNQWTASWDNEKEEFKEKYPDLIEVTIEVAGPERLSFQGTYKFRPEVPLRGLDPSF
ncbi:type II secretion system protein GspJ, partial [Bdellovibrionota bacterium FG-1]